MRILPLAAALVLAATLLPARADPKLDAAGFEAHVTGQTITYQQFDYIFGVEEYLPGRKVRWSVAPGDCQYGSWYPEDERICFVYDHDPTPHCWYVWLREGRLVALADDAEPGYELTEIDRAPMPLDCPAPGLGV